MLTQYDAMILAGIKTSDPYAAKYTHTDARNGVLTAKSDANSSERISRLEILLEPVDRAVTSIRALLGNLTKPKPGAHSITSPEPTAPPHA